MASLLQGAAQTLKQALGKKPARQNPSEKDRTFLSLTVEDALSSLYQELRCEDRTGRLALNRLWFMTALYFQGKQNVRWNPVNSTLDVYEPFEGEDWYTENQFRKDVWANVKSLNAGELNPKAVPDSEKPEDVAVAKVSNSALGVIYEDIEHDRIKTSKHMSMCLYGNAFIYNTFNVSKDYGVSLIPKYEFKEMELPGMSVCPQCNMTSPPDTEICPQCGGPMEQVPMEAMETPVATGEIEERPQGRNLSFVTTPLEMYTRAKVKGGLKYAPYLFWVRRLDRNIVLDARPEAETGDGGLGADDDQAQYYIDVLSTLAGGVIGGGGQSSRYFSEVEYAMCWVRKEMFRGHKELMKKYPNGVQFETANGQFIKGTDESKSMDDCWTHYTYYPNTYSFWGDGMVDCLPIQDQMNETNSLMIRYLRYCTMSKKLYNQNVINPEWLSNNPEEAWIPASPQLDIRLQDAVFSIEPTQLSQDVSRWKDAQYRSEQDMSGAYDSAIGKSTGANASYSKQVFEAERAQGRFAPMFDYNRPAQIQWTRQLLNIFRDNALDERKKAFIDNAGQWSFETFMGADLGKGSCDIKITETESIPKSRTEIASGLELLIQLVPIMPLMTQKQKAFIIDFVGLPTEGTPETLQIQRAHRKIQKIRKGDKDVVPMLFVDDLAAQIPTFAQYLASEDGDKVATEEPEMFSSLYEQLVTMVQMQMLQQNSPIPVPGGAPPGQPPGGQQMPNQGTPKKPDEPERAQSPVPEDQQVPMPPLPQGARG